MPFSPAPKFILLCGLAALWIGLAAGTQVFADETPPARIAVIGDAESQDLSALVGKELSGRPDVTLVEREDLSRLGDERKLELLAGSDAVALGKLVGADGLLFVNKTATGFNARFTAVGLGYALFDDPLTATRDPDQLARSLAHRAAGYTPKLKLDPAEAVPLSILNLRADHDIAESTALERTLTLLLESRLAAIPEYVLLERRHAWSLGFERSLDPAAKPLLHGAYLIDGTVNFLFAVTGNATVTIRVRSLDGTETTASAQGKLAEPSALVDRLLVDIKKAVGKAVTAPVPAAGLEAREYLLEGLWALRAGMYDVAMEAIDSAGLLGANAADVEALRIEALFASVDHGMEDWYRCYETSDSLPKFDAATLAQKTGDALRGIREIVRFRDEKMAGQIQLVASGNSDERLFIHTENIRDRGIYRASKLLFLLDRAKSPQADELRQALRALTEYDPLHGHPGLRTRTHINEGVSRMMFVDDWSQTLEEEMAYYRLVCTDKNMDLPTDQWVWTNKFFCARFFPQPDARQKAFDAFVHGLKGRSDCRFSYLILKTHAAKRAAADRAYRALLRELWNRRTALAAAKENRPLFDNLQHIPREVEIRNGKAGFPLLHYLLTAPHIDIGSIDVVQMLWQPEGFSPARAATLWRELDAYSERIRPIWIARNRDVYDLDCTMLELVMN